MSKIRAILLSAAFASLSVRLLGADQQPGPDLILLVNGKVFTSDLSHAYLEALAIRGDRIAAAGSSERIAAMAGPRTKRIDWGGRVVIPGINDAHFHCDVEPAHLPLRFKSMDPTWKEVAEELTEAEAKAPKGFLVLGEIGPTALDDQRATITSLDKLAPAILSCSIRGHSTPQF
jgi:predicted amidohydrolase YtcJ